MNKKIRFGFIGAGKIANTLADAFLHVKETELYAVAARDIDRAKAFKEKYGFKKAYGSYEEMLQDENVDAVYISTIHSLHYEHCLLALKYNKPVLCEKSLTTSLKDTIDLYKKFKEKNILLVEALWTSFQPFNTLLNSLIFKEKIIGKIKNIKTYFNLNNYGVPRINSKELGGGAILDLGIYSISFILRILSNNFISYKIEKCKKKNNVDIIDRISFIYKDNIKATAEAKVISSRIKNEAIIKGRNGKIIVNSTTYPTEIKIYSKFGRLIKKIDTSNEFGGYVFEISSFIDALNKKEIECKEHAHEDSILIAKIQNEIVNK